MAKYSWRLGCIFLLLLSLVPTSIATAATTFPDLPATATYTEAVRQLAERGIIRGYPDGRFGPADPLLRAQTAVTLVRATGLSERDGARSFNDRGDTDPETWAAVRILADHDIARGFSDGNFHPVAPLTRQQAISFVSRTMVTLGQWQQQAPRQLFNDVAADHRADVATYIYYAGTMPGTAGSLPAGANPLDADATANRAWYAELLWIALEDFLTQSPKLPIPSETQPSPTPAPTGVAPSASPTPASPSPLPSLSLSPSTHPTASPTPRPSAIPSTPASPSPAPSVTPSPAPSATPTPTTTFLRGVDLAGAEFGSNTLPGTVDQNYTYPTASELDYYRSKGLNLIRLPFRWERLQRELYAPLDANDLGRIDTFVAAARARNMYVILDPHNYARYHGQLIGTSAVPNAAFADFWGRVAAHYQGETAIWAYGLMNEPHDTGGLWPAAAQAGVDGIRAYDPTHTILVPGDGWSGAAHWADANTDLAVNDPAANLIYEAHQYFDSDGSGTYRQAYDQDGAYPSIGADRLKPFTDWLIARNARGFIGEFGVPDNDPRWLVVLDQFLTAMDNAGLSGTYWAGGPWWGNDPLAIEPRSGQDRPQLPILVKHLGR